MQTLQKPEPNLLYQSWHAVFRNTIRKVSNVSASDQFDLSKNKTKRETL